MVQRLDFLQNFSVNQAVDLRCSALILHVYKHFQICYYHEYMCDQHDL